MNDLSQQIFDILKSELSPITSKMIIEEKCKTIGKDIDTVTVTDLKDLIPAIMGSVVLLLGGEVKTQSINKKLTKL